VLFNKELFCGNIVEVFVFSEVPTSRRSAEMVLDKVQRIRLRKICVGLEKTGNDCPSLCPVCWLCWVESEGPVDMSDV
jgi:hypothetical protein